MKIKVHMLAYGREDEIREVEIPDLFLITSLLLEKVFHFGQNEIQPKSQPSLTAGDVIEMNESYFLIKPVGFEAIDTRTFQDMKKMDRMTRLKNLYGSVR